MARDERAARDAGDHRRADAIICARALLAHRRDRPDEATSLWAAAFDHDPTLLVAYWGLTRMLRRQGAWADLQAAIERRIAVLSSPTQSEERADLWLDHGRIAEDRLLRDDAAARSYRFGAREVPDHLGLLTSLLLLGFRRADPATIDEALTGLLRRPLPAALRVSLAATLVRVQRGLPPPVATAASTSTHEPAPSPGRLDSARAAQALETLRTALRAVGPTQAGPLVGELFMLAHATADPAVRAEILGDLVSVTPEDERPSGPTTGGGVGLVVALMRERARLLRDRLGDPAGAAATLRAALARLPGHPGVITDLADAVEALAAGNVSATINGLRELLAFIAPGERALETSAEKELAIRYLTALAQDGRSPEAIALLTRHPEVARDRPDVRGLEVMLRAASGDTVGLAGLYEHVAEALVGGVDATAAFDGEAAAQAFVIAGTLLERKHGPESAGDPAAGESPPARLYRRALEIAPGYAPARDVLERRLWSTGQWRELTKLLDKTLARLRRVPGDAAETGDAGGAEAWRVLEELVAIHRDRLDDPMAARACQDELVALVSGPVGQGQRRVDGLGADDDLRAWVRRHDLELAAAVRGHPSSVAARVRILRALAERATIPALASALRVEAARVAVAGDDVGLGEALLREALPGDVAGTATSGLERLAAGADRASVASARVGLIRAELARVNAGAAVEGAGGEEKSVRLRALRFRLAHHAFVASRPEDALDALGPLRASGDPLAQAWSWEIARRSGNARLQLAILPAVPPPFGVGPLIVPADLAESLERAGDFSGAEAAYRQVLRTAPSMDAALGLLRIGSALGNAAVVLEAAREMAARPDDAGTLARLLSQEVAMLALFQGAATGGTGAPAAADRAPGDGDDASDVVLRWASGIRDNDALGAAAGLLGVGRVLPSAGDADTVMDRNGLLARAAARARLGGAALAGAVHDQVTALSAGAAPIGVGLADLPVAGRPERIAARVARAERNGGDLAYALDVERALDAEARGDRLAAVDGFAQAWARDPRGIEALDGIKRMALATGDRAGAARAGMRLGAVLRVPARAAAELSAAAEIWEDLGMPQEAASAYWQALSRERESDWLYERLRRLLVAQRDGAGLDQLYSHRLALAVEPEARIGLLLERARHRLEHLDDRKAAIEDFKRILKIDPDHPGALRDLATLATQMEYFTQAVRFLERLIVHEGDEERAADLRLELADAYESAREPARAVEVLRQAASARPRDVAPWQRLTDLLLRIGDWSGALATLRSWDAVLADPSVKAGIWIRIGCLLRDQSRDVVAAAQAFSTAAELDPLGDGIRELVALQGQSGVVGARQQSISRAIADIREMLAADPLDVARVRRLKELCDWLVAEPGPVAGPDGDATAAATAAADAAVGAMTASQLLALLGEDVERLAAPRVPLRGSLAADFWNLLRAPGGAGLAAELWPTIAAAAAELFPPAKTRAAPRERIAPRSDPRLAWVEEAAAAVGLPALELWSPRKGTGDPGDESVTVLDGNEPALLLGRGVVTGTAAARFRVGRALSLLRDHASILERLSASDLASLFLGAAVVAGVRLPDTASGTTGAVAADIEARARALAKAMPRRDRKTLELKAPRLGSEPIDAALFRQSVLSTADRLGLVMAGDIAVAARLAGELDATATVPLTAPAIAERKRAVDLIHFALSSAYLTLRRESGAGEV